MPPEAAQDRLSGVTTRRATGAQRFDCRHTFASMMIAAGVNAEALSAGHANIAITMDCYGHLMPGNEPEATGLPGAYLARA